MKSFKLLLNSLANDSGLRQLSDEELSKLRSIFLETFLSLEQCCKKYNLTVMLIGGSALGAVRHQGFIPWDDDLDVAMSRADFEKLKTVFDEELGEKYILASPNYKNNATNRFPMILVKDTLFVEAGNSPSDFSAKIKIDIFIIENIPKNYFYRKLKGLWCSVLMAMGSYEETYEHQNEFFKNYMCKTKEGRKNYNIRLKLGKLFSFFKFQKWMNIIDNACQYKKETNLLGIPSGRGHYFGEILPREAFFPVSKGLFENNTITLPGRVNDYLQNLYGDDYMTLPPEEKRERHFIVDVSF